MKLLKRSLKILMYIIIILVLVMGISTYFYMKKPMFGALPEGKRLELIQKSDNYKDGRFRNIVETPTLSKGYSMAGEVWKTFAKSNPRKVPTDVIPSVKTNLKTLNPNENVMIWFGHSSFFLQIEGVKILVDPVFSGNASPIPGSVKSFKGTDIYSAEDMPEIDYLLLSHDHYDHLDYETIVALKRKIKTIVCGLGAGAHFEKWGFNANQILEKDWGQNVDAKNGIKIFTESTHHDSGRTFRSGQSLWVSFYIQAPSMNIYYSGDGGYDARFKEISQKYPKIDWAIMECGQYDKAWQSVHELPEEMAMATAQLQAKNMIPIHNSKFALAKHPWDEPLNKITEYSKDKSYRLATPLIGEKVDLNSQTQVFQQWWKNVK